MKFENIKRNQMQNPDLASAISNFQGKKEKTAEQVKANNITIPSAISLTNDIKITGGENIVKWLQPGNRTLEGIKTEVAKSEKELFYILDSNVITDHSIKDNYHAFGGGTEDGINWYLPKSRSEGMNFNS